MVGILDTKALSCRELDDSYRERANQLSILLVDEYLALTSRFFILYLTPVLSISVPGLSESRRGRN